MQVKINAYRDLYIHICISTYMGVFENLDGVLFFAFKNCHLEVYYAFNHTNVCMYVCLYVCMFVCTRALIVHEAEILMELWIE